MMPKKYVPRPGVKRYQKIRREIINEAVAAYRSGMSLREAGRIFGIHFIIIGRYAHNKNIKKHGGQTVLSKKEEDVIVKTLQTCVAWRYPIKSYDLRTMVKNYLDNCKIRKKFGNNLPGHCWVEGFLTRHKSVLPIGFCQNQRAAEMVHDDINNCVNHLEKSLARVSSKCIVNYNEFSISNDPCCREIITKRGCKYHKTVGNSSNSRTSIMFAASGDGVQLPCSVVCKANHMYPSMTEGGPKNTRYSRSQSGWFETESFDDWVLNIAIPYLRKFQGKKILIGDYLSTYLSVESIKTCCEENIEFIFLPSTHSKQLDEVFFGSLVNQWRQILTTWKLGPGRLMTPQNQNNQNFHLAFTNICGIGANINAVHHYLESARPHALFLTETQISGRNSLKHLKFPGYELLYNYRLHGGVGSYVRGGADCCRKHFG